MSLAPPKEKVEEEKQEQPPPQQDDDVRGRAGLVEEEGERGRVGGGGRREGEKRGWRRREGEKRGWRRTVNQEVETVRRLSCFVCFRI